jgi:AraC-like DNA-binding protein
MFRIEVFASRTTAVPASCLLRSWVGRIDALVSALKELRLRCELLERIPGSRRVAFPADAISLHLVLSGEYLIDADVETPRFVVRSDELLVVNRGVGGGLRPISDGDGAEVLSARVQVDAPLGHPMLEALPKLIRTSPGSLPRSFGPTVHALQQELSIPVLGAEFVVQRLCEVLFVQALRHHIRDDLAWNDQGFFRLLADPVLSEHLGEACQPSGSVSSLARALGRTRQRTHARFKQFGATSPSAFLRHGRVRVAAELLRAGETDLARVAMSSGYGSQQALSRAFRREFGTSPAAHWRSLHRRPFPRRRRRTEQDGP